MTTEQELHLRGLVSEFETRVRAKYQKGAEEHGGNLWEKPGIIEMILEEIEDLWVYTFTLKQQLDKFYEVDKAAKDNETSAAD